MAIRRRRRTKSLAAQTFELGMAAPQVIAHRMARMAAAGTPLSARDRAEFQRMSIEKLAAINEAWSAIAGQAFIESQNFGLMLMQSLCFPWMRPAPTAKSMSRHWNRAAASILGKGMAPLHRRAVANAKRLRRIKSRS